MVLCSGTCPPARFEQIAGQTVAIFEDNVFENGCAEASLRIAQQLAFEKDENGHDDAFAVLTLNTVIEQFRQWRLMLPRVKVVYINDGVYGSFNCILFDHFQPRGHPLFETSHAVEYSAGAETKLLFPTIIWGQTCDGLDQVEAQTEMRKMNVGEWLYYENMGAYTSVAASNFNGFSVPNSFYAISESAWKAIEKLQIA
uniref:Orn_DAP_Arg_deC domain-containing protein n=1 Tax=Globodera pallida TaxID=36090 RepID=A0A183BIN2_GLOPA